MITNPINAVEATGYRRLNADVQGNLALMNDHRHYLSTAGYRFASDHFYVLGRDLRVHTFDLQGKPILDPIELPHWDSFGTNKIYHIGAQAGDFVHWCYSRYGISRVTDGKLAWSNKKLGGNGALWFAAYSDGTPSLLSIFGSKGPRCAISADDGSVVETYRALNGLCSAPSVERVLVSTARGLKWRDAKPLYRSAVCDELRDMALVTSGVIFAGYEAVVLLDDGLNESGQYPIDRPIGISVSDSQSGPVAAYADTGEMSIVRFKGGHPSVRSFSPSDNGIKVADGWEMTLDLVNNGQCVVSDSFVFNIESEAFHELRFP